MNITKQLFSTLIIAFAVATISFAQTPVVYNYTTLNQPVNDLVYSASRRMLYASIPSSGGEFGNFIIAINPFSKQIVDSVFVGSEPNRLVLSGDESVLYVGLDGAASVRKVVLDSFSADLTIGLGSNSNGLFFAEDIAVLPNQPNSIAVSRRNSCCSPRHEGVAIYDNGVMRSITTPGHTGSNAIESDTSTGNLYGYNNETTDFGFRRMTVDPNGVTVASNLQNAIQGFNVDIQYSNGFIYSTNGVILNPVTNILAGTFQTGGFANSVAADPNSRRVFFIMGNIVKGFNSMNFQPTGNITLADSTSNGARLTRWGRRGLAYRTGNGKLVIFETSLVPSQPNVSDFDGDEIADYAVYRSSAGQWFSVGGMYAVPFGISSDTPVSSDYDGDGKSDIAVFRDGTWFAIWSSDRSVHAAQFGLAGDLPVSADYDGDQKTDLAVYRGGTWYISRSSDGQYDVRSFGLADDKPVQSDFDGDGKTDLAVFRPSNGTWYISSYQTRSFQSLHFGLATAVPKPADYDGDGISDVAVWQNTFGQPIYYYFGSRNNRVTEVQMGNLSNAIPFAADFDGDSIADPTVFSQSGVWTSVRSRNGSLSSQSFGTSGDQPISPQ